MTDFIKAHVFNADDLKLSDFHLKRMILYPKFWNEFALPDGVNLTWRTLRFGEDSDEPNFVNQCGIYTFIVQPGIAGHPNASFLIYVGKTTRSLRTRYQEYKRDLKKSPEKSKRPYVVAALRKWQNHLFFSYAPLMQAPSTLKDDKLLITRTENALIKGFLPCVNKEFTGEIAEVGQAISIALGN
jgi:hypothetical protein